MNTSTILPAPEAIDGVILKNERGMVVALSDYGARIVGLAVPDRNGTPTDVVLGFSSTQAYLDANETYHGVTIGRFANRIAGGCFTIGNETYHIQPNNGPNALHGGTNGFHRRWWERRAVGHDHVTFFYHSPDGEEGFPGNLSVTVRYRLTEDNGLEISYRAETDKPTVINLTNHAFFNLNGEGKGDVLNHIVQIHADRYLPVDPYQIPTGDQARVAGTPFDFRTPKPIGRDLNLPDKQLAIGNNGYDHNFLLNPSTGDLPAPAAIVFSPDSGIQLEVLTTEPGLQLYTGNFLNGSDRGKSGLPYEQYGAFCLESQHYPDSPNQPEFPSTLLSPGEVFQSVTVYRFSVVG